MVGEHIRTRRGGQWTHAIDCGDATVIHLANGDAGPLPVRRTYRPEFVSGADAVEVVTHRERTFPPAEVVARAYSRLGDPALAAMFRDSEAFAAWCETGRLPAGAHEVAVEVPAAAPQRARAPSTALRAARGSKPRASKPRAAKARTATKRAARKARPARVRRAKAPRAARTAKRGKSKPAKARRGRGR